MAFTTIAPTVRAPARGNMAVAHAVPRNVQNAVASVLAAVPLVLAPAACAGDLFKGELELPKIDYDSSVTMDKERSSQSQFNEPDYNTNLEKAAAKAEQNLPEFSNKNTQEFTEGMRKFFAGDLSELPLDTKAAGKDVAAEVGKAGDKIGNKAEAATGTDPLASAQEGLKNAGAEINAAFNSGAPEKAGSGVSDAVAGGEKNANKAGNKVEAALGKDPLASAKEGVKNLGAEAKETSRNVAGFDIGELPLDTKAAGKDVAAGVGKAGDKIGNKAEAATGTDPLASAQEGLKNAGADLKAAFNGGAPEKAGSEVSDAVAGGEKNVNKAGNKVEAAFGKDPLASAKEGVKNLGAEAKETGRNVAGFDVGELPTDVQSSAKDVAAETEKNLTKANEDAKAVTEDGPLSAATQGSAKAGAEVKGEAKKFLGLF